MEETSLDPASITGAKILRANSSLKNFSIALGDGRGISLDAVDEEGTPAIQGTLVPAEKLPAERDAVCSVDWGWIVGATINQASVSGKIVRLQLEPGGPLNVSVGSWQGSPFLSFQPYKPLNK